ncbi:acyl carrier protein [Mesosutterella sp. OilRF-GAM-744-9]|uniref:Acyl carrier protein n=2 Tax=Mesosutterella TaxID=2494213 RepID=A0ABS9MR80_9BURK|nr:MULTISPECIES: acyl carrier protein [unclassified Mesosutterella]MCG5031022.1 acyl carrier protein [Mesosutterella sp. oilRF-744-WT-GAM-9]MCI6529690.1 acyl carrier protein [Mesosutterella sp.]MDL2059753.1 acyl carrier protein [Mesosutterella sp. AGMB02718]
MEKLSRDELYRELLEVLEKFFEVDPSTVKPETKLFEDLDLDSIDAVDMVVQMQKKTGRRFQPDDFRQVKTVSDVLDVLERLQKDAPAEDAR